MNRHEELRLANIRRGSQRNKVLTFSQATIASLISLTFGAVAFLAIQSPAGSVEPRQPALQIQAELFGRELAIQKSTNIDVSAGPPCWFSAKSASYVAGVALHLEGQSKHLCYFDDQIGSPTITMRISFGSVDYRTECMSAEPIIGGCIQQLNDSESATIIKNGEYVILVVTVSAPSATISERVYQAATEIATTLGNTSAVTPKGTSSPNCKVAALASAASSYEHSHGAPDGSRSTIHAYACDGKFAGTVFTPGNEPDTGATMEFEMILGKWKTLGVGNVLPRSSAMTQETYTTIEAVLSSGAQNLSVRF
jgi:hypothetical protein